MTVARGSEASAAVGGRCPSRGRLVGRFLTLGLLPSQRWACRKMG
jgi:hypothetical protein